MYVTAFSLALALLKPAGVVDTRNSPFDCRLADEHVEAAIARWVAKLHGIEYCQYRRYDALSDVDGDGRDDFIVLFNVEPGSGGNAHSGFMAVFLSRDAIGAEPLIVATGGRGQRDAVAIHVRDRKIILDTLEYLPSDPLCCPSGHGTLVFELSGHSLRSVETKAHGPKKGA